MVRREIAVEEFLARLPLFSGLDAESRLRVARATQKRQIRRGDTIFRRGQAPDGFFVVIYGDIALIARGGRGTRLAGVIGPSRSFGEPVMFLERPYLVDAVAQTDALLLHIPKAVVFGEIDRNPRFAHRMIAGLARRIEALVEERDAHTGGTARQRLAAYLLRRCASTGGETSVQLPATKAAVASQLGLTAEHFSRVLRDLERRGLLRVDSRSILIPDVAALAAVAGPARSRRREAITGAG